MAKNLDSNFQTQGKQNASAYNYYTNNEIPLK